MSAMPPRTRSDRRRPRRATAGRAAGARKRATGAERPASLKNIVWLASYPKSGNTWVRVFLANYLLNASQPVPINQVHRIGIGDSIAGTYSAVAGKPYDPQDYLAHLRLRDRVLHRIVNNDADINFVKTHNTRERVFQTRLVPAKYTRSAIYILRDPLDVAVSYARHYGLTTAEAAECLSRDDNVVAADATSVQQYLGSWSTHARSWVESRDFPVQTIRYEDMKQAPRDVFSELLSFLGVPVEDERLDRAVRFSSFGEMQRQETEAPFAEKSAHIERFFHSGRTGQWKDGLAPDDAAMLRRQHGAVMKRFGYL